jgi:hypothetical protein
MYQRNIHRKRAAYQHERSHPRTRINEAKSQTTCPAIPSRAICRALKADAHMYEEGRSFQTEQQRNGFRTNHGSCWLHMLNPRMMKKVA